MERRETDGKGSYAKNAAINKRGSAAKMAPRARTPSALKHRVPYVVMHCLVKCSGIGVEFAEEGLHEYTNIQIVNVAKA